MERNISVDILRGISIAIVVIAHVGGSGTSNLIFADGTYFKFIANSIFGVAFFFVISGFLITTTSFNRFVKEDFRKFEILKFYMFRISRIFPPLICLVVLNLLLHYMDIKGFVLPPTVSIPKLLLDVFLFRFNYFYLNGGALLPAWAVLWSLAIEEVFYIFFPLVTFLVRRAKYAVIVLIGLILYAPYYRHIHGWGSLCLNWGAADLLAWGCLAALVAKFYVRELPAKLSRYMGYSGLLLVLAVHLGTDEHQSVVLAPSLIGLGVGIFLFSVANGRSKNFGLFNKLTWFSPLGRASYELYLFHMSLGLCIGASVILTETVNKIPHDVYVAAFFIIATTVALEMDKRLFAPARAKIRSFDIKKNLRYFIKKPPKISYE